MSEVLDQCCYRGAIALNNYGVTFLEKGDYRSALATLKDAVTSMKMAFQPASGSKVEKERSDVSSLLKKATKRSRPLNSQQERPLSSMRAFSVTDDEFEAAHTVKQALFRENMVADALYSIRFEVKDIETHEKDMDLESAIMLNNFGLAHLCLYRSDVNSPNASTLINGAYIIFSLARSLFVKNLYNPREESLHVRYLLFGAVVTRNFIVVLGELVCHRECQAALRGMFEIQALLSEFDNEDSDPVVARHQRAAAAA
jgi:hypothetical protein